MKGLQITLALALSTWAFCAQAKDGVTPSPLFGCRQSSDARTLQTIARNKDNDATIRFFTVDRVGQCVEVGAGTRAIVVEEATGSDAASPLQCIRPDGASECVWTSSVF